MASFWDSIGESGVQNGHPQQEEFLTQRVAYMILYVSFSTTLVNSDRNPERVSRKLGHYRYRSEGMIDSKGTVHPEVLHFGVHWFNQTVQSMINVSRIGISFGLFSDHISSAQPYEDRESTIQLLSKQNGDLRHTL